MTGKNRLDLTKVKVGDKLLCDGKLDVPMAMPFDDGLVKVTQIDTGSLTSMKLRLTQDGKHEFWVLNADAEEHLSIPKTD